MESRPALFRAAHLYDYISVLREIGAPVDRELARSQLPQSIEESPDHYVSLPVALEWLARTGHDLEPMELGFLAALKTSLSSFRLAQRQAIMTAQTVLCRLEALAALCRFEDSIVELLFQPEADDVGVICKMEGMAGHPYLCFVEWKNLLAVIAVIRTVAGPSWYPIEMSFESSNRLPQVVHAAFPHTRILVGQPHNSVLVARADLARTSFDSTALEQGLLAASASGNALDFLPQSWDFISLMRMLVEPYVGEGRSDVAFAARMVGMSTRTLQRKLMLCGSSYSQIVQQARFQIACAHLEDPSVKVIEIAMMTGYESPQHFTRAFRRFTGVTPSEYRHHKFGHDALAG